MQRAEDKSLMCRSCEECNEISGSIFILGKLTDC